MNKFFPSLIAALLITTGNAQSVGIGTNTPNSSAKLDVVSSTQGFLPPRLTYAQRNEIINPVAGLVIWCSDCYELQVYNGTIWKNMGGNIASLPTLPSIAICSQVWAVKNLDVMNYRDGSPIPEVTDPMMWQSISMGAWCWYDNDSGTYAATYGRLYNWRAVTDPRGLAPLGWHIPTKDEFDILSACLGGESIVGGKMKETGTTHWVTPNTGATNVSGFTALPAGYRDINGIFGFLGIHGLLWSSSEYNPTLGVSMLVEFNNAHFTQALPSKSWGVSVCCVKD